MSEDHDVGHFYDRVAAQPEGLKILARARLQCELSEQLHGALEFAGMSADEVYARMTGKERRALRRSEAVMDAVASFLHICGLEMTMESVLLGQPRAEVLRGRSEAVRDDS